MVSDISALMKQTTIAIQDRGWHVSLPLPVRSLADEYSQIQQQQGQETVVEPQDGGWAVKWRPKG